ncbi:MAG: 30S ribosomal protein S12 methylthiotransferase RimO [Ignavibacteria bacterium]|nr:30S ribosomal protein S12 methylthiotransferase RimO [Ignavibacteria bacterium]
MKRKRGPGISVITLGCSKNVVDTELLLGQLGGNGARLVEDVEDAEIAVVNTCGFIEAAKQESVDAIVEAVQRKNIGRLKKVVVMGCLSERYAEQLAQEIPDVDAYYGSHHLREVVAELGVDFRQELLGERVLSTPSHSAYLKISEGCDHPCSFCAIPLMRGTHRTRPLEEVVGEAQRLADKGVKELILIGQDTTYYGVDRYGERRLETLLRRVTTIGGIEWIRLMYAFPAKFPMGILNVYCESPKLCRYLDIPVQHASDDVLRSMRRGVTRRATRELIQSIREKLPDIALRTTLIVGYPNETERDYEILCDFVSQMKFHRLGVFTYSQEDGTAAYDLGDPIPKEVKEARRDGIMQLQQGISLERNQSLIGSTVNVLFDRREGDFLVGRTEWDAPEIDQEVYVTSSNGLSEGSIASVRVVDATEYDLFGEIEGGSLSP